MRSLVAILSVALLGAMCAEAAWNSDITVTSISKDTFIANYQAIRDTFKCVRLVPSNGGSNAYVLQPQSTGIDFTSCNPLYGCPSGSCTQFLTNCPDASCYRAWICNKDNLNQNRCFTMVPCTQRPNREILTFDGYNFDSLLPTDYEKGPFLSSLKATMVNLGVPSCSLGLFEAGRANGVSWVKFPLYDNTQFAVIQTLVYQGKVCGYIGSTKVCATGFGAETTTAAPTTAAPTTAAPTTTTTAPTTTTAAPTTTTTTKATTTTAAPTTTTAAPTTTTAAPKPSAIFIPDAAQRLAQCVGSVGGFPTTPGIEKIAPFTRPYFRPEKMTPTRTLSKPGKGVIDMYEINVKDVDAEILPGVKTRFLAYCNKKSGKCSVPGPTFHVCRGRQTLVRFHNQINFVGFGDSIAESDIPTRTFSTHLHGAASLAPWDGWADDTTNTGEFKDYLYPNNRGTTLWYHDHSVHITADNAYLGLAGMYIIKACCDPVEGEPGAHTFANGGAPVLPTGDYDVELVLGDKVLDNTGQLRFSHLLTDDPHGPHTGPHQDDLYGDINLVNGVPMPYFDVEARRYLFRALVGGPTRPYYYSFRKSDNTIIPVFIVGQDGGMFKYPVQMERVRHGVGERLDIVMDFTGFAGQTLYLINEPQYDEPFFCMTHLLVQFRVGPAKSADPSSKLTPINNGFGLPTDLMPPLAGGVQRPRTFWNFISDAELSTAISHANNDRWDREFTFVRSKGMWLVKADGGNAVGWQSTQDHVFARPAVNRIEVWHIVNGGGGWFHPIHIHLIDFMIVRRKSPIDRNVCPITAADLRYPEFQGSNLCAHEVYAVKDVVYLGPSEEVWVIARFGPYEGDYMFHCHNLVHEDNDMMIAFGPRFPIRAVPKTSLLSGVDTRDLSGIQNRQSNSNDANVFSDSPALIYQENRPDAVATGSDHTQSDGSDDTFVSAAQGGNMANAMGKRAKTEGAPGLDLTDAYIELFLDAQYYRAFYPTAIMPPASRHADMSINMWESDDYTTCNVASF